MFNFETKSFPKVSTQSKKRNPRKPSKTSATAWQPDRIPTTAGEKMLMADNCLKWLKTKMDRECLVTSQLLTPFRHVPVPKMPRDEHSVSLCQEAYDYFPLHTQISLKCPFCKQCDIPTYPPDEIAYWKNPYTRRSWTPLCAECSQKTLVPRK